MIVRDKNRSSIVLWSLANETPVIEVRNKFLTKLADEIKVIDDTRLLTAALRIVFKDNVLKIDDPLGDLPPLSVPLLNIVSTSSINC